MLKKINSWYKLFVYMLASSIIFICSDTYAVSTIEGIQVYQKVAQLSPEHKQKVADDLNRYRNADNIWDVLREEFSLPHYEDNPAVQEKIDWFMNNQDFLLRSATRSAPYLYYILQQVRKRHLPAELVLLPIIESGYNPFSMSPVGAAGVWQLMPSTATGLGVKQDWWYDGRRDVIASTRAALNHLAYLQSFFDGNWLLAIAAYNTGEGNVLSAIKRNIRDGEETDFWSLSLAQETRDYVPSLLALAIIISHPDQYPVYFPPVRNAPYLAQIDVGTPINLKYAASLAGISHKKLLQLNPGFNRPSTSTKGPYKLVLPIENIVQFTENLTISPLNHHQVEWVHYKVKPGDTLPLIAKKFKTTTVAIRKLNHLNKPLVSRGTHLLIPNRNSQLANNSATPIEPPKKAGNQIQIKAAPLRTITPAKQKDLIAAVDYTVSLRKKYRMQPGDTIYMIRTKDTLQSIAKRFRINRKTLEAVNRLKAGKVTPGRQIIIPTHLVAKPKVTPRSPSNKIRPGDTIYMVRHGDTIEKIARKFKTTPASIRLANLIDNTSLVEGEKLVVPTHLRG